LPSRKNDGKYLKAFERGETNFSITFYQFFFSCLINLKIMAFRSAIAVPVAKVNPCFMGVQVHASGFAENLHPPSGG
jgi:hypothetical protein